MSSQGMALVLVCGVVAFAQAKPDFSGTWTMDPSRSEAAAQGTPIGPVVLAIRQMPEELRIETTRNGTAQTIRYLPAAAKASSAGEPVGAFRWDGSAEASAVRAGLPTWPKATRCSASKTDAWHCRASAASKAHR